MRAMTTVIFAPVGEGPGPDAGILDWIAYETDRRYRQEAEIVERRIKQGETDFTLTNPFTGRTTRYLAPTWRRHPVRRLRLALARRRA